MALALLRPSECGTPGSVAFQLDLGGNRYWQFAIGDDTVSSDRGFPVLGAPVFTSPLMGPPRPRRWAAPCWRSRCRGSIANTALCRSFRFEARA
jgi:hypothetical protein